MTPSFCVENLGKKYKRYGNRWHRLAEWLPGCAELHHPHWVLRGVSFTVNRGSSVGIIGQNGAGKSTLLKILSGTTRPSEGSYTVNGRAASLLELGMGFHPDFTGRQNAFLIGQLMGLRNDEIERLMPEVEAFAEIGDYLDQPLRTYSSGMIVRLAFASATAVRPDVLMVDEALSVGDAYFQHKCFSRIRRFKELGTTLLFVSHDPGAVKNLCDRAILLDRGILVKDGCPEAVLDYYNAVIARQSADEQIRQSQGAGLRVVTRSGNGAARIHAVDVYSCGRPISAAQVGEEVEIEIRVEFFRAIDNPTVGVMLKDRLGNEVFGTNTYHLGTCLGRCDPGEVERVRFHLPLNVGTGHYSLTAAVHDGPTHLQGNYDWWDHAATLQIIPGREPRFTGVCFIPSVITNAQKKKVSSLEQEVKTMSQTDPCVEPVIRQFREAVEAVEYERNQPSPEEEPPLSSSGEAGTLTRLLERMDHELDITSRKWNVSAEYPITSHRPVIGRVLVLGKRMTQKLLRWYMNPLVEQQRDYNSSVIRSLSLLGETVRHYGDALCQDRVTAAQTAGELEAYGADLTALSDKMVEQQGQLDVLSGSLALAGERLTALHEQAESSQEAFSDLSAKVDLGGEGISYLQVLAEDNVSQLADLSGRITLSDGRLSDLQSIAEASASQLAELSSRVTSSDGRLSDLHSLAEVSASQLADLSGRVASNDDRQSELQSLAEANAWHLTGLSGRVETGESRIGSLQERVERHHGRLASLNEQLSSELALIADRMRRIERRINQGTGAAAAEPVLERLVAEDRNRTHDLDYFLFEHRYRGSREKIRERQKIYLDYFKGKENVLDVGCGRGEFVELMVENGFDVTGIDINEDMVNYCRERDLPVIQQDLFQYLNQAADGSLGGLFAAQLLEHLTPGEMLRFVSLARVKLKATGVLLMETINPRNLIAITDWFNLDPTHTRPVHPQTLQFILESEGFHQINFVYSNPVEGEKIPHLVLEEGIGSNAADLNEAIDRLNEILYGPQDYAAVAVK